MHTPKIASSLPLAQAFHERIQKHRKILSLYLTAGFPTLEATLPFMQILDSNGADLIELGIPFSDPLADGPTIQRSSQQALQNGMTTRQALEIAAAANGRLKASVILMGYFNPIVRFGTQRFVHAAAEAGVQGLIIPDLLPEESTELRTMAEKNGISLVYLVSPNTSESRTRMIDELTSSFIYAVSVTGVTGARKNLAEQASAFLARLRSRVRHPVLVGFGVSSGEDARQLASHCEGVIVGSALLNKIEAAWGKPEGEMQVERFVRELRMGLA